MKKRLLLFSFMLALLLQGCGVGGMFGGFVKFIDEGFGCSENAKKQQESDEYNMQQHRRMEQQASGNVSASLSAQTPPGTELTPTSGQGVIIGGSCVPLSELKKDSGPGCKDAGGLQVDHYHAAKGNSAKTFAGQTVTDVHDLDKDHCGFGLVSELKSCTGGVNN